MQQRISVNVKYLFVFQLVWTNEGVNLQELYTWDRGNQLTYPIRYHDQGLANLTNLEDKGNDNSSFYNRTGVEIETQP